MPGGRRSCPSAGPAAPPARPPPALRPAVPRYLSSAPPEHRAVPPGRPRGAALRPELRRRVGRAGLREGPGLQGRSAPPRPGGSGAAAGRGRTHRAGKRGRGRGRAGAVCSWSRRRRGGEGRRGAGRAGPGPAALGARPGPFPAGRTGRGTGRTEDGGGGSPRPCAPPLFPEQPLRDRETRAARPRLAQSNGAVARGAVPPQHRLHAKPRPCSTPTPKGSHPPAVVAQHPKNGHPQDWRQLLPS